jgi:flagellar basal-body rod protein FlgC
MKIDRMFGALNISAFGLTAQRTKMNAIASNLANAETTRAENGAPYRRKIVSFKERAGQAFASTARQAGVQLATTNGSHMAAGTFATGSSESAAGGIEATETQDGAAPRLVYDPGHPDADANGYVTMPNVNVVTEMVGMISASRAFEANVVAINAAKAMAKDSLEI